MSAPARAVSTAPAHAASAAGSRVRSRCRCGRVPRRIATSQARTDPPGPGSPAFPREQARRPRRRAAAARRMPSSAASSPCTTNTWSMCRRVLCLQFARVARRSLVLAIRTCCAQALAAQLLPARDSLPAARLRACACPVPARGSSVACRPARLTLAAHARPRAAGLVRQLVPLPQGVEGGVRVVLQQAGGFCTRESAGWVGR